MHYNSLHFMFVPTTYDQFIYLFICESFLNIPFSEIDNITVQSLKFIWSNEIGKQERYNIR